MFCDAVDIRLRSRSLSMLSGKTSVRMCLRIEIGSYMRMMAM